MLSKWLVTLQKDEVWRICKRKFNVLSKTDIKPNLVRLSRPKTVQQHFFTEKALKFEMVV